MVKITYYGPIGNHFVTSPMRRVGTYGIHTRGDVFSVDEADQKAKPDVFVPWVAPEEARAEVPVVIVEPEISAPETPLVGEVTPEIPVVEAPVATPKPAKQPAKKKARSQK